MKKLLLAFLLIPAVSFAANEADVSCELQKATAEVTATTLADPSVFIEAGDPVSVQKNVAVGLTESVSGFFRAKEIRSAAKAKCGAIYAETDLDLYEKWAIEDVKRKGDLVELKLIEQAIELANTNVLTMQTQLSNKIVTLADVINATQQATTIESRKADLLRSISTVIIPPPSSTIEELVVEANHQEAVSAQLNATSAANTGWDFSVSVGARKPLQGVGPVSGFVTATAKYSFGSIGAHRAAREVGEKTEELLNIQQAGYRQTLNRHKVELDSSIVAEMTAIESNVKELGRTRKLRAPLIGIESGLAQNAIRDADIQIEVLEATISAARARLSGYQTLRNKL